MCRRGRGCHRSRTAYTRPDRPAPEPSGSAAISDRANGVPDPTKSRYEAFCALCGLGLMYRVRCANAQSLGLVEPMRELPPVSGMGVQAPVGPGYEYDYYLRLGDEGLRTLSCWSKNAIGSRYFIIVFFFNCRVCRINILVSGNISRLFGGSGLNSCKQLPLIWACTSYIDIIYHFSHTIYHIPSSHNLFRSHMYTYTHTLTLPPSRTRPRNPHHRRSPPSPRTLCPSLVPALPNSPRQPH